MKNIFVGLCHLNEKHNEIHFGAYFMGMFLLPRIFRIERGLLFVTFVSPEKEGKTFANTMCCTKRTLLIADKS